MNDVSSSSSAGILSSDVVILCGGLGTRLRSVLPNTPKPMADIAGRPFLQLLIEQTALFGFRRFVLCLGYKAEDIERFFRAARMSCDIEFSRETQPMGTGGAVWNAKAAIRSDPFVVLNGDSFCGVDLPGMIEAHVSNGADVTMAVAPVGQAGEYGRVMADNSGRVISFLEKDRQMTEAWVNGGVYVCSRRFINSLGQRIPLSLEHEVFPSLAQAGSLFAYRAKGPLLDIGTPDRYERARQHLLAAMSDFDGGMRGEVV